MSNHKPSVHLGYPSPAHGRIPSFRNIEDEAAFWDTNDTADFPDEFTPVDVKVNFQLGDTVTLRLDRADRDALARFARKKGIEPATLARIWIKEHLEHENEAEAS